MATSLLELATRIQSMELSFTTILMETSMKLASLTDANVFMIVDTQEGRRFSGKDYLCNAYLNSQLTPSFGDVQVFVDPSVSAVDLKTLSPDQQHATHPPFFDGGLPRNSPNHPPHLHTQRVFSGNYPLDNRFRKRTFIVSNGNARRRNWDAAHSSAKMPKSSSPHDSPSVLKVEPGSNEDQKDATSSSMPPPQSSSASTNPPHASDSKVKTLHDISDDDDNDDYALHIVEGPSQGDAPSSAIGMDAQPEAFTSSHAVASAIAAPPVNRRYSYTAASPSQVSCNGGASSWVSSAASLAALDTLTTLSDVTLGKIVAAKEFPLEQILTKGSAANKLLCSILYDVVKDISKICTDLGFVSAKEGSAKDVFYALLEKFVKENFPNLLTTDLMFYEGTNRMSAIAYIRSKTRVMFFMRMKALAKKFDVAAMNNSLFA